MRELQYHIALEYRHYEIFDTLDRFVAEPFHPLELHSWSCKWVGSSDGLVVSCSHLLGEFTTDGFGSGAVGLGVHILALLDHC